MHIYTYTCTQSQQIVGQLQASANTDKDRIAMLDRSLKELKDEIAELRSREENLSHASVASTMQVYMCVCVYMYVCIYVFVCMYVCMCLYVCMYVCMYVCV